MFLGGEIGYFIINDWIIVIYRVGVIQIYVYLMHSSPYLFVCGDDRVTYYPGVDDVSGEPGDA